jgi:hypothetical protein
MHANAPNIKVMVAAGASPRDAIKAALRGTFAEFAARHAFFPSHVSNCVNGRQRHERIRDALAADLGVERAWLDELLDGATTLAHKEAAVTESSAAKEAA